MRVRSLGGVEGILGMNETVDPDSVARARPAEPPDAPAPPEAPVAPALTRKRRWLGKAVFVLVLAALAVLAWQYYENIAPSTLDASRKAPAGPPPQTVRATAAALGEMPITIDALGTVIPLATVTVK